MVQITTLGYKKIGTGPLKVLFLHGWLSDYTIYDEIIPFFDAKKYTMVFADYRGYGLSSNETGSYTIEEIAQDVIELATSLGWINFTAIGHSMGGMVLQKVACLQPDLLKSIIAVTPVPASGVPLDEETTAFFGQSTDSDEVLTELFDALTGKQYSRAFNEIMTLRARPCLGKDAMKGYFKTWTTTDFSSEVANLKTPVYVIAGEKDGGVGPEFLTETYLKQLPNVEMETISGAGHYPMQETPVQLFTMIERHLARHA